MYIGSASTTDGHYWDDVHYWDGGRLSALMDCTDDCWLDDGDAGNERIRLVEQVFTQVVNQQFRAGTKNSIIIGLANGMIGMSDPVMHWVMLLLDQRMVELAEVPLEDASPRGPPQQELIPC